MTCGELGLGHKDAMERALQPMAGSRLSAFAFPNLYVWKPLYRITCGQAHGCWCVFFTDGVGCFMPMPPFGGEVTPAVLDEAFGVMDRHNPNRELSRIENIPEGHAGEYAKMGCKVSPKPGEYLCGTAALASLSGNALKHKRSAANHFAKQYPHECGPYRETDKAACLDLYRSWMEGRQERFNTPLYRGMLSDSFKTLAAALDDFQGLGLSGMVVRVGGEVKGFTAGCPVCADTFCVMYEVTDLECKGISQFIFREFAASLSRYQYLNLMDDSGLENLAAVKRSYHPVQVLPAFIATRSQ